MEPLEEELSPVKSELDTVMDVERTLASNTLDQLPLQVLQHGSTTAHTGSCSTVGPLPVMQTQGSHLATPSTDVKTNPDSMSLGHSREEDIRPYHRNDKGQEAAIAHTSDTKVSATAEKVSSDVCDISVKVSCTKKDFTERENSTDLSTAGESVEETAVTGRVDLQLQCPECNADNDFYVCEGTVRDDVQLGEKVKIHVGEKLMHCKSCGDSFSSCYAIVKPCESVSEGAASNAKRGRRTRASRASNSGVEKPYKCEHCDKSFNYRYSFKVHLQTHTGEKSLQCTECDAAFRRPHRLYEHMKSQHRDTVKLIKCSYCPKHFTTQDSLHEHTRIHTMERPYTCVYCPSSFKTRFDLDRHMLVHTGEKPYKCNQCSAAFKRPFSLSQHIKSQHTEGGKKPRQPSLKPRKKYTRRNDTRERPFKCEECDCAYMTAQKLKDHTILKHNAVDLKKTYTCQQCNRVFRKISDLNVHIKSHW
ncbi:zinc finger protein 431-like [Littorina saxatilis]|uniref:C2H2-type domain-containing protein n=1 Tax=Littorina saxatilis TaxID=31220 RepID=A0AAN9BM62_9CAEN